MNPNLRKGEFYHEGSPEYPAILKIKMAEIAARFELEPEEVVRYSNRAKELYTKLLSKMANNQELSESAIEAIMDLVMNDLIFEIKTGRPQTSEEEILEDSSAAGHHLRPN